MLSREETKWLVDNAWHRPEMGGRGHTPATFLQNLFTFILSGKRSEDFPSGFPFMSKPQITGAPEPLAPQSSQAWQGRTGSGTCVYKPPEFFCLLILFWFSAAQSCLCIIVIIILISTKGVTLWVKWAKGSSGCEPTGGSREQRRASLAWAALPPPGKTLPVCIPLEGDSLWTHRTIQLWSKTTARKARGRETSFGVQLGKSLCWGIGREERVTVTPSAVSGPIRMHLFLILSKTTQVGEPLVCS